MEEVEGAIVFTTLGRPHYGFDIFSLKLPLTEFSSDHPLTNGTSVNFNGQFVDDDQTLVCISEKTGSPRIYLTRPGTPEPELLPSPPDTLFLDRPIIKNNRLYFVSAHESPDKPFKSWSAVYSAGIDDEKAVRRLTPYGFVDFSPAISRSGEFIAVASYQSRPWAGEFHDLKTDIVVFRESDPTNRVVVCEHGGWPTWSGDSTIYFHRQSDDGWWSIFRVELPENLELFGSTIAPRRITPSGVHCFTPAAMHDGEKIVVATRRRSKNFRHIEIFDVKYQEFHGVTEQLNPNYHHYNPFVSPESGFLGYHRFRGSNSSTGESIVPHLERVKSPLKSLGMYRINGCFPSFSANGDLIAINHDFDSNAGISIIKSDGSKRWNLLKGQVAFYNSWSPAEKNVIFSSVGPIFDSSKASVQIARICFEFSHLSDDFEDIKPNVKFLTRDDTGNNAFPSCSPDGNFIVFRSGRSGHKNLYIADAVNGEFEGRIRQLTEGPWIDTMPSWSPDGGLIAFSSNRHNPDNINAFSIYLIHPDGTGLRRVHVAGPKGCDDVDRERINHVCFSPDGEWLLFTANLGGLTAEPVSVPNQYQPYGDVYVVRLDGSGLRRLTWNGYENGTPAWHPGSGPDIGLLGLKCDVGDVLKGEFDEPLWITCDF